MPLGHFIYSFRVFYLETDTLGETFERAKCNFDSENTVSAIDFAAIF